MRRFLLLVVSIASLALPAGALAGGGNYTFDGGTKAQRSQVRAALGASTFDWDAVPTRVTIHIQPDIPTQATPGHIWLDARLVSSGPLRVGRDPGRVRLPARHRRGARFLSAYVTLP